MSPNEKVVREVAFAADKLRVSFVDGRELSVPLSWFPRLKKASPSQRKQWELIGGGLGIHWPLLDEDIFGRESARSSSPWAKVSV